MMHDKADDGFYSYAGESNGPVIHHTGLHGTRSTKLNKICG